MTTTRSVVTFVTFVTFLVACEFASGWQSPYTTALTLLAGWVLCDLARACLRGKLCVSLFWKHAGLAQAFGDGRSIAFGVRRSCWVWGVEDQPCLEIFQCGLGPLFVYTRAY